jgi:hypothetical protein
MILLIRAVQRMNLKQDCEIISQSVSPLQQTGEQQVDASGNAYDCIQ